MTVIIFCVKTVEERRMRVTREKAAETRRRIIESAAIRYREKGFDGVGVAEVMRDVGLTHGGFYGHFDSKEALMAQASAACLAGTAERWAEIVAAAPERPLAALVDHYLSERHRDQPGNACIFPALASDAARQCPAVRAPFTDGLGPLLDVLQAVVAGADQAERRARAIATMAALVGGLLLARAVDDRALSDEILAATRHGLGG